MTVSKISFGLALLLLPALAVAQETAPKAEETDPATAGADARQVVLADVGTWDAEMQTHLGEGRVIEAQGVEVNRACCGDLWVESEFVSEEKDGRFEGRGLMGYDAQKKKYVSVWVDSMGSQLAVMEGDYDAEKKLLTMSGAMPGKDGKMVEWTYETHHESPDKRHFYVRRPGPDGELMTVMTIQYTRRSEDGKSMATAPVDREKVKPSQVVPTPDPRAGWPKGTGSVTLKTRDAGKQKVAAGQRVLVLKVDGRSLVGTVSAVGQEGIVLDGKILVAASEVGRIQRIK
jgi:hypothetical protein